MAGKLMVVVGGQFGSEGKGAIAAHLGKDEPNLMAVRVAGPNAGHSAVDPQGKKWALRQLPVAAMTNPDAKLVIAAGSEIDEKVLYSEIDALGAEGYPVLSRLYIDREATVIEDIDVAEEAGLVGTTGSTGKGIGSARARRALRQATIWGKRPSDMSKDPMPCDHTPSLIQRHLDHGGTVLIEGTQGYGLGLHAGFYPHCTSSDCRAIDFMAMAGVSPWAPYVDEVEVWVVLRTFPIRIAGPSGPMYAETTWEELAAQSGGHIQPEITTVTQKTRRVGHWDTGLAQDAIQANGGDDAVKIALTFFDYWYPGIAGETGIQKLTDMQWEQLERVEMDLNGAPVRLIGTGPDSVIDLRVRR